jgi:ligand-binding sensor domain-containing protein
MKLIRWSSLLLTFVLVSCIAGNVKNTLPGIEVTPTIAETHSLQTQLTSIPPTQASTLSPRGTYPSGWTTYTDANDITDLAFDRSGQLWVSSKGGVTQWDLSTNTYLRYTTTEGLPSNNVSTIYVARDGKIWIGTQYGQIADYDGNKWNAHEIPELSRRMKVTDILQDQKGDIWFSTYGAGAIQYDGKEWKVYLLKDGLASVAINGIAEDAKGDLWFETFVPCCDWLDHKNVGGDDMIVTGLSRYRDGSWSIIDQEFELNGCCMITRIAATRTELWIAPCSTTGMCSYDGDQLSRYTIESSIDSIPQKIFVDNEDNVWFLTFRNGVEKYDRNKWTRYTTTDGLTDNNVTSGAVGPDGKLWFGTAHGLSSFDGNSWRSYMASDPYSSLPTFHINDLKVDSDNILWMATYSGIVRFDGITWQVMNTDNGLPVTNDIRAIAITSNNQYWIGNVYWPEPAGSGDHSSILYYDGRSWTNYRNAKGSQYIGVAEDGSVWAMDYEAVYKFSSGQWINYPLGDSSPSQLLLSPDNSVWLVGGMGNGVFKLENDQWVTNYDGYVERMAIAPDGTLWLAETLYGEKDSKGNVKTVGLSFSSFTGNQWIKRTIIPNEVEIDARSMVFSSDGSLWVCAYKWNEDENGLYRFYKGQWVRYTINDGLSGNSVAAIYTAPDGALWFVTEGGLTRYDNLGK